MRRNKLFIIMLLLGICSIARGQTSQYWFDNDYDGAKASGISNGTINVDVSTLQPGVHTLHYLYKTKQGLPSSTHSKTFLVPDMKYEKKGVTGEYWFDQDYANKTVSTTVNGLITFDASTLTPGVHTVNYHQLDDEGLASMTYAHSFLVAEPQAAKASKGEYWFDSDYDGRKALAFQTKAVSIDLSGLEPGLHTVHYHALNSKGLPSVAYTSIFWIAAGPSMIKAYHYWVNNLTDDIKSVSLETPANPYKLVTRLDVPEVPVRTMKFHFEIVGEKPTVFAKNTLNIQFENTVGGALRQELDYVDYRVSEAVDAILLNPGDQKTVDCPAGLQWFKVSVNRGDSVAFKANRRCTMQLFSATGRELWSVTGDVALKTGGCRVDADGISYLAVHDVTDANVKDVTVEYQSKPLLLGDVNSDDKIDITDATSVISHILGQTPAKFNEVAADMNTDGEVNIVDVTTIIDVILGKE